MGVEAVASREGPAAVAGGGVRSSSLPAWAPLLVFAAVWLAHGSALGADWIGDDVALVRDSAVVARGPAGLAAAFGPEGWTGAVERGVWRPLTVYSFCLEAPLWERGGATTPFGFHLTNLVLHGLAALLLLGVGRRLVPARPVLVVAAALVFAVHPLYAQAVLSLAGRADLLALVFSLLAILLWIEARRGQTALLPLAALAFFLALLSKETALGLPLVLLLLDAVASRRGGEPGTGTGRLAAFGVLVVPALLWAWRWPWASPDLRAGLDGLGAATAWFFVPVGWTRDLVVAMPELPEPTISPVAAVIGAAVLVVGAALLFGRTRRGGAAGLALATTAILWSAAVLVAPAGQPLTPRFAYVPAFALAFLGGALLHVLWTAPRRRVAGRVAVGVVLGLLGLLTWTEGRVWADAEAFEQALLDRHPESDPLLLGHAKTLRLRAGALRVRAAGQASKRAEYETLIQRSASWLREAEAYAQAVLRRVDPTDLRDAQAADAYRELGYILQDQSQIHATVEVLREALRLDPWLHQDERREEMPAARRALIVETLRRLARAETAVSEGREAAVHLAHAAELAPDDVSVLYEAGRALARAGEYDRARSRLERALVLVVDVDQRALVARELEATERAARRKADEKLQRARLAIENGRYGEAVTAFEEALAIDPTLLRAHLELALHLGQWFGRYGRAYEVIGAAERVLREVGYPPDDAWWRRFADLRRQLKTLEREDLAEEEGDFVDERDR